YLLVRKMSGQAVAAQQEGIQRPYVAAALLEFGVFEDADGACDDVAARPALRLFRGENAAFDQFLRLGMIAADLGKDAASQQVGAAVAGPDADIVVAIGQH